MTSPDKAPELIWATPTNYRGWDVGVCSKRDADSDSTAYVRADLHDALASKNEALRAEVERLVKLVEYERDLTAADFEVLDSPFKAAAEKAEAERDQALAQLAAVQRETIERCANLCDGSASYHMSDPDDIEVMRLTASEIRDIPLDPDAEAALKRHDAKVWNEAVEACSDHCWAKRDLLADAEKKQVSAGLTGRDYYGRRLEAELLSRSIRALARPTEGEQDV